MRSTIDSDKVQQLMAALGRAAKGPGNVYFTGGASAVLVGWRGATVDIDVRFDLEAPGIFEAIAKTKQDLNINIEPRFLTSEGGSEPKNSENAITTKRSAVC